MSQDDILTLAQRLREYSHNPHHINPMSDAFHKLIADSADALSAIASDYATLEAECERLRNAPCECGAPVGYVSGDKYAAEHERLRECRAERDALSAELAALKAASGEEVEAVVRELNSLAGEFDDACSSAWMAYKLGGEQSAALSDKAESFAARAGYMRQLADTVAQHQRITAALRGEVEQCQRDVLNLQVQRDSARENMRYAQAELDAIRKQEPVVRLELVENLKYGGMHIRQWDNIGRLTPGRHQLYAAPPAAAMDGGMVGVPAKLIGDAERRVPLYEAVERACGELPDGWTIQLHMEQGAGWVELYDAEGRRIDDFPTNNERLDFTLNDAIDAAHRQASQQEGEKT